jgi:hypothetical protein
MPKENETLIVSRQGIKMKKSDINPMPPNFAKYIDLVADVELEQAFHDSDRQLNELDKELLKEVRIPASPRM